MEFADGATVSDLKQRLGEDYPAVQPLLKTVVVHTTAGRDGWKITAIEGPLP